MSIALVLGSGGHTSELLKIVSSLPEASLCSPSNHFVIYSDGDSLSMARYLSVMGAGPKVEKKIPRARRVGQSYFTSVFSTIHSLIVTCFIFLRKYPKIVILTISTAILIIYLDYL